MASVLFGWIYWLLIELCFYLYCWISSLFPFWMSAVMNRRLCWDAKGCRGVCVGLERTSDDFAEEETL